MSAFLKKLFKPKWQSANATTRKEHIATLNSSNEDDNRILLKLASNDADNQVRRAAINQLDSVESLLHLYKAQPETLKPAIVDRLTTLSQSNSLPIYEMITDEAVLIDFITQADSHEQYIPTLSKLSTSALEHIATSAKHTQLRQAATTLIEDEASLVAIEKRARNKDKKVYQQAKNKLKIIKENNKRLVELQQKREALVQSLEDHANTESITLYSAKFSTLLSAWENLAETADKALEQRFLTAKSTCEARVAKFKDEQERSEREADQIKQQNGERKETLLTLEETANRFKDAPINSSSELSALDAIIKTQENRWIEATRDVKVEASTQKQYQQLMHELKMYLKAARCFMSNSSEFSYLLEDNTAGKKALSPKELTSIQGFIRDVEWPTPFKQPDTLQQLTDIAGATVHQNKKSSIKTGEVKAQIETIAGQLEQALNDRALKQSIQLHKELTHLIHNLDKQHSASYSGRLQLLGKQLHELRDWQGFAVTPKQTELCEHMEQLASLHQDPAVKAQKIKEMQDEWKRLGGAADQKMWLRFKAASDKAYEPCQHYFEEQRQVKKNNLEKRKTICQQLSDFVAQNNWESADWKAVENINRKAREEWKHCYPVEFKQNKAAQKTFNELLSKIDHYLDQERLKNKQLKESIVERAQALTSHEPVNEAINEVKKLQSEWQKIGITLHKDDRKLWKEYRAACDQIFSQRETELEHKKQETNQAVELARALCDEVAAIAASADEVSSAQLAAYRQRLKDIPTLPKKELDKMSRLLEQHIGEINSQRAAQAVKQKQQQWADIAAKSSVIRDITDKIAANEPYDSILSENVQLFSINTEATAIEQVLQEYWDRLSNGQKIDESIVSDDEARSLCIQCEIAAELDSPEGDKGLRMQLQVNRLSKGLNTSDQTNKQAELIDHLGKWFEIATLPENSRASLEERINKVISQRVF